MNAKYKKFCDKKKESPEYHSEIFMKDCTKPITIFCGPNGTGKSMSMMLIYEELHKNNICCVTYSNKHNDIVNTCIDFDPVKMMSAFHSEGERIRDSINNWGSEELVKALLTHQDNLWALIDEIDSGLSYDRLYCTIKEYISIQSFEKQKHPNREFKYVFTCNSYEMLELFKSVEDKVKIIWLPTKEEIKIGTYEKFKQRYYEYYEYMFKEEYING